MLVVSTSNATPVAPLADRGGPVRIAVCAQPGSRLFGAVSGWLDGRSSGVTFTLVVDPVICDGIEKGAWRLPATLDVAVHESRASQNGGIFTRIRITFAAATSLEVQLHGRTFSAALASSSVEFPARSANDPASPDNVSAVAPSQPEAFFFQGIVELTALRRQPPAQSDDQKARLEPLPARVLALLARADQRAVEYFTPSTSAVIKQLRAMLILEGACAEDTAAGLLRAAARLVPYDAEARAAAAIGRLKEGGDAFDPCLRATEQELLRSVALDRWSHKRVDDLGQFYELSMNAASGRTGDSKTVPADEAAARLATVWEGSAPQSPRMVELGVAGGLTKTVASELWRTLTPAAHIEATFGRDRPGFGLRLGITLPWTREIPVGTGTASWTRLIVSGGARYRNRFRRFYWEAGASLLVAPAFADGHGFDRNLSAVGLDAGMGADGRMGLRFGQLSLWLGVAGSYFVARQIPGWPDLTLRVGNLSATETLPDGDVAVMMGISQMVWR